MPQSLTRLPKEASFKFYWHTITIQNHRVVYMGGFFGIIVDTIQSIDSSSQSLYQLEKHGISFEMAIEYCAHEFEHDISVLAYNIGNYGMPAIMKFDSNHDGWIPLLNFSESKKGRAIAEQFIEKIRSCSNWKELCDELCKKSEFSKNLKKQLSGEVNLWYKI